MVMGTLTDSLQEGLDRSWLCADRSTCRSAPRYVCFSLLSFHCFSTVPASNLPAGVPTWANLPGSRAISRNALLSPHPQPRPPARGLGRGDAAGGASGFCVNRENEVTRCCGTGLCSAGLHIAVSSRLGK
jgi:hypothetical protein